MAHFARGASRRATLGALVAFTPLFAASSLASCGGSTRSGSGFDEDAGDSGGGGGPDGSGGGDSHSLLGDGGGGDGTAGCTSCSADLHDVTDCANPPHVLKTCPATEGCGANGACVPACEAAAANKSSIGCDYYSIPSDGWSDIALNPTAAGNSSDGSCFAAFVTNNWGSPMKVTLEYGAKKVDASPYAYIPKGSGAAITYMPVPSSGIPAGSMAIVFLGDAGTSGGMYKVLCPASVTPAFTTDIGLHGTGIGNAMHLTTSVPAVVYDIYPYGGAKTYISSATLLLPTSSWDTNYVAVTAAAPETFSTSEGLASEVEIVAMSDNTQVTMVPTAAIAAGTGVQAAAANTKATFKLNAGQLLQFTQMADLSGSPLQSNNPIGVWAGHYCMNLPSQTTAACDAAHQEIPPVKAAGNEYVAVRYKSRTTAEESVPWRIMGMVKGTQLTYDPPQAGAPTSLNVGQLVEFESTGPFDVKSQDANHPFYLAAHMTGGQLAGGLGDPETVNVTPPAQYLASYIFFTDPTYSDTDLVLIRGKQKSTYADVTLDCSGTVSGWAPIGSSGYEFARVDVQSGGSPVGKCDNGLHTIKSTAPFGITVWGYDQYVSYAYPAGASVRPINNVVVPPTPQ